MFPMLFGDEEECNIFVDYYNTHQTEHIINLKSIVDVQSIFRETKLPNL